VHLYAAFLGGELTDGRMGEDHEVVFVVADDVISARRAAKANGVATAAPMWIRSLDST